MASASNVETTSFGTIVSRSVSAPVDTITSAEYVPSALIILSGLEVFASATTATSKTMGVASSVGTTRCWWREFASVNLLLPTFQISVYVPLTHS